MEQIDDSGSPRKNHSFTSRDHKASLTPSQIEHFDEEILLRNTSPPADQIDMERAVESVKLNMGRLFP